VRDDLAQIRFVAVEWDVLGALGATNCGIVCAEEEGEETDFCGRWGGYDGGEDVEDLLRVVAAAGVVSGEVCEVLRCLGESFAE